jgi:predicted thioesterase
VKDIFQEGDLLTTEVIVSENDVAEFNGKIIHSVYSTFALGRDAEWACRQFVLQMKEDDEEGVGTFLTVQHHSPAKVKDHVTFEAVVESIQGNEIICHYTAKVNDRLIADGKQGQKILKKTKIQLLFGTL